MRKIILFVAICLLGFASLSHGEPTEIVNLESAGQVVIEAEDFTSRSNINGQRWEIVPGEAPGSPSEYANYRGTGYIQLLPDLELGTWGPPIGTVVPPGVNYKVRISTVGTYRLYVRMDGNSGSSDSFYASIAELNDGIGGTIADWYRYVLLNDMDFATSPWQGLAGFERLDAVGYEVAATWDITAPGDYTIRIIRREDGTALDTLILQLDSLPAPTSTGPVASATVNEPYTIPVGSACIAAPSDMVSWWPADLNANDIVGGNNGTLTNGATLAAGAVGGAFSFDGVDDYVAAPSIAPLITANQITIDAWVKPSAYNNPAWCCAHIIGLDSAGWMTHIGMDPTNPYLWTNNGIYVRDPDPLIIGAWQHIAATYDGTTAKFYRNGVLKSSQNIAVTLPIGDATMIGASKTVQLRQFAGLIDEVEVFNRALSASEIQAIYNAGDKGKCKSQPPVADAGDDQSIHQTATVNLNGIGSTDPDGDPLTYSWQIISTPSGSTAVLSDATAATPTFVADLGGDYVARLVVTDSFGVASAPDEVTISTYNTAPFADAGPDQSVVITGSTVQLDGTQSYDADGDAITHLWSLTAKPATSAAFLSDLYSDLPTFVADVYGDYTAELVVSDPWVSSAPDSVVLSFNNVKPVAKAGGNQSVVAGDIVYMYGFDSDANGDPVTYSWSMVSKPAGSSAVLADANTRQPSFTTDKAGTYVVSLVVNDGTIDSDASNASIEAISTESAASKLLVDVIYDLNTLDPDVLKNKNMVNSLTQKINSALRLIEGGHYDKATVKLLFDLLTKMDGCVVTGKTADKDDWITECSEQKMLYEKVRLAIKYLSRDSMLRPVLKQEAP
jgi:hypothetical protein